MKIACIGGGPAGLYFAISMKLRDPAHEIDVFERNRAGRHLRLGRRLLRPDGRESARRTIPISAQIDRRRVRPLGRYRRPHPRRDDHARRATASSASAASGCSKSCRTARASSASRCTSRPNAIPTDPEWARLRPGHRLGRRQQPHPRRATPDAFGVDIDVRAQQVRLARHAQGVRRLHLRLRGDRARLDLGARLSLRARLLDLHRRMFGGDLARPRLRPDGPGRERSPRASSSSPNISTATRCMSNAAHLRGSAAWLNFRRIKCERWTTATSSCSATPRTPRISRSARAPSSRSRMRSSWPRCSTARASASKRRSTNIRPSGTSRC